MIPIVTPEEMAAIDAAAPDPVDVLIERAGAAVARCALEMLGGSYGRRVTVVAGSGNNGNDGRSAAHRLRRRGVKVQVLDAADLPTAVPPCDLVIDAAYGTGLRRPYHPPALGAATPVLAVDIPSGVDGRTGELRGEPWPAARTVTFAALKPGLLLPPGRFRCGEVQVVDIGLDASRARAHLVETGDLAGRLPAHPPDTHKWRSAVWMVAGSPGMAGAARLAAAAAMRTGAGYVRLSSPGGGQDPAAPTEVVQFPVSPELDLDPGEVARFAALVVGPGLGRDPALAGAVRSLVAQAEIPVLVDGDGLAALGDRASEVVGSRSAPTVLTPHDGEFRMLAGEAPGADRLEAARSLAERTGAVVLLKGPTTVVAEPRGDVLVDTSGDRRLATAGTGDVLVGMIAGLVARGAPPWWAAAAGAHLHGACARSGPAAGLVAGDLVGRIPDVLATAGVR